jgi:hypothetical protein
MTHESNCFLKEGIGSFGQFGIRVTFSHLLFFLCPVIRVVGKFIKIQGNPCPNFFFKRGRGYLICQNYSILVVLVLCPWYRQVCWLPYYIKLSSWWEDLFKYR